MTAGAGATGARAWLATRRWRWLSPARLRRITGVLLVGALLAASVLLGASTA